MVLVAELMVMGSGAGLLISTRQIGSRQQPERDNNGSGGMMGGERNQQQHEGDGGLLMIPVTHGGEAFKEGK